MTSLLFNFVDRHWSKLLFVIGAAIVALSFGHFVEALRATLPDFPNSWSWTEMVINYQGGFIKRGLIGQIAYLLDDWIPAASFILLVLGSAYLFCMVVLVAVWRLHTQWAGLFFLLSPTGLLFPIHDTHVALRKDILIVTALISALLLIRKLKTSTALLPLLMVLYFIATLVVEISWLYFPIVFCVYLHHQPTAPLKTQWLLSVLSPRARS